MIDHDNEFKTKPFSSDLDFNTSLKVGLEEYLILPLLNFNTTLLLNIPITYHSSAQRPSRFGTHFF